LNVEQQRDACYNRGVGDVVGIAGMAEGGGIIAGIIIIIIIGTDLAGLICIHVFIHGHMVLKVSRSNCKTDLAKVTYYKMKNHCGPMISDYHYHKNLEQKISDYHYDENFDQKISD
jgi:hypothetical protein